MEWFDEMIERNIREMGAEDFLRAMLDYISPINPVIIKGKKGYVLKWQAEMRE